MTQHIANTSVSIAHLRDVPHLESKVIALVRDTRAAEGQCFHPDLAHRFRNEARVQTLSDLVGYRGVEALSVILAHTHDDRVLGVAIATPPEGEFSRLLHIGVATQARRSALGTQLYKAILTRVHSLGARHMTMETLSGNRAALAFLRAREAQEAGSRRRALTVGGTTYSPVPVTQMRHTISM